MRARVVSFMSLFLVLVILLPAAVQAESRIGESRYVSVTVGPKPEQMDLLQSIVNIHIPETITTIGEALDYLLEPYGFHLESSPETDEQYLLLILALPDPHRHLGSMTLIDALTVLGGKSFQVVINPVKRTVRYQLRDTFDQFVTAEDKTAAKQQWLEQRTVTTTVAPEKAANSPLVIKQRAQQYWPVEKGDNLSRIASQIVLKGMTRDQALVYLFRVNPHAFANNNMNHLLADRVLIIPPIDPEILPTALQARRLVNKHYYLWQQQLSVDREVTP